MEKHELWATVIVKICGMTFDIVIVGGAVYLIGWQGWSTLWMILAIFICRGSWVFHKSGNKND